jgi:hypothetical protein
VLGAPDARRFSIARTDLFKLWRRARSLASYS